MEKIHRILTKSRQEIVHNGALLMIKCHNCSTVWNSHIYEIRRGRKCPLCNESSGERSIRECLEALFVPYVREIYTGIGMTRYDFVIRDYKGRYCVVEFDGIQHFQHVKYFHRSKKRYLESLAKDKKKTERALSDGYRMLRISYKSEKYIGYWIWYLLHCDDQIIYSDALYR